jgi:hypothetical protein
MDEHGISMETFELHLQAVAEALLLVLSEMRHQEEV